MASYFPLSSLCINLDGCIMAPSKKKISAIITVLLLQEEEESKICKKKRDVWVKTWLKNKEKFSHMSLLKELQENNPDDFRNYLRMTDDAFRVLLALVSPKIAKKDTVMRKSIPAEERLIATLRYLATGRSLEDLKFSTGISAQALGHIIPETCQAIYDVLREEYLKVSNKMWLFFLAIFWKIMDYNVFLTLHCKLFFFFF